MYRPISEKLVHMRTNKINVSECPPTVNRSVGLIISKTNHFFMNPKALYQDKISLRPL
jgi:hypothetical protein